MFDIVIISRIYKQLSKTNWNGMDLTEEEDIKKR